MCFHVRRDGGNEGGPRGGAVRMSCKETAWHPRFPDAGSGSRSGVQGQREERGETKGEKRDGKRTPGEGYPAAWERRVGRKRGRTGSQRVRASRKPRSTSQSQCVAMDNERQRSSTGSGNWRGGRNRGALVRWSGRTRKGDSDAVEVPRQRRQPERKR